MLRKPKWRLFVLNEPKDCRVMTKNEVMKVHRVVSAKVLCCKTMVDTIDNGWYLRNYKGFSQLPSYTAQ